MNALLSFILFAALLGAFFFLTRVITHYGKIKSNNNKKIRGPVVDFVDRALSIFLLFGGSMAIYFSGIFYSSIKIQYLSAAGASIFIISFIVGIIISIYYE